MKYLFKIDTTKRYEKSAELTDEAGNVIDRVKGDIDTVAEMKNLLNKHKLTPKDIKEVVPNVGPGSFTGIKIGISIANVFNWGRDNKVKVYSPNYGKEPNIEPLS